MASGSKTGTNVSLGMISQPQSPNEPHFDDLPASWDGSYTLQSDVVHLHCVLDCGCGSRYCDWVSQLPFLSTIAPVGSCLAGGTTGIAPF